MQESSWKMAAPLLITIFRIVRHVLSVLCRYNYQSRLLAFPFLFYLGTFAGRMVGGIVTGTNAEYGRDKFLGTLPAESTLT